MRKRARAAISIATIGGPSTPVDVDSGEIARDQLVRAMRAYTPAGRPEVVDPWQVLTAEEKYEALKRLLEDELTRVVPTVLGTG